MQKYGGKEITLTDDPLENIKIMAPLLDKQDQENVFIYITGLFNGVSKSVTKEG